MKILPPRTEQKLTDPLTPEQAKAFQSAFAAEQIDHQKQFRQPKVWTGQDVLRVLSVVTTTP